MENSKAVVEKVLVKCLIFVHSVNMVFIAEAKGCSKSTPPLFLQTTSEILCNCYHAHYRVPEAFNKESG